MNLFCFSLVGLKKKKILTIKTKFPSREATSSALPLPYGARFRHQGIVGLLSALRANLAAVFAAVFAAVVII